MFPLTPALSQREREASVQALFCGDPLALRERAKGYPPFRNLRVSRFSISTTKNITPATARVTNQ